MISFERDQKQIYSSQLVFASVSYKYAKNTLSITQVELEYWRSIF